MCLRATAAQAPQLRDRWFCIATPEDADLELGIQRRRSPAC
ncbi:hypothetical protein ACFV19_02120 [Streptomyces griseoluteus]